MEHHVNRDNFAKHNGIKLIDANEGNATTAMKIELIHLNGLGLVHGGAIFTLGDFTLGTAVNSLGGKHVTMNASINFIKAASEGVLIGIAKKIAIGRTIATYDIEIRLESTNELIAIMRGSSFKKE